MLQKYALLPSRCLSLHGSALTCDIRALAVAECSEFLFYFPVVCRWFELESLSRHFLSSSLVAHFEDESIGTFANLLDCFDISPLDRRVLKLLLIFSALDSRQYFPLEASRNSITVTAGGPLRCVTPESQW